jgi:hypothetical protein
MKRLLLILASTGSLVCASFAPAATADTANAAQKGRRDINACMWRRMAADRRLSYNEAATVCKAQLALRKPAPAPQLAANNNAAR